MIKNKNILKKIYIYIYINPFYTHLILIIIYIYNNYFYNILKL